MFHKYFDHTYLINLDERTDRLAIASTNCSLIGLQFERFSAVSYKTIDSIKDSPNFIDALTKEKHWSKGAVALIRTTIQLIEDAKKRGFKSILILEDDVTFDFQNINIINEQFSQIPSDWEMIQFGAMHIGPTEEISSNIVRVSSSEFLHCYAIKETIYDTLLELLKEEDKPLDHFTAYHIHPRGKSYCFTPNLALQYKSFSNIVGEITDYDVLKVY